MSKLSIQLKKNLYNLCIEEIEKRISHLREAIQSTQESANDETKSSSGDKYETGRAMMHNEIENYNVQLDEARRTMEILESLRPDVKHDKVKFGAMTVTSRGIFFISVSLGKLKVDDTECFAIGTQAPMAQHLLDAKAGDKVQFNGAEIQVNEVC